METTSLIIYFYGREASLQLIVRRNEYEQLIDALKSLSAGQKQIPGHFIFTISDKVCVLLAIKEIQALHCVAAGQHGEGGRTVAAVRLDDNSLAVFQRGRSEPLRLLMAGKGPLDDMFHGLTETRYDEELPTCVMLADADGSPFFLRLDEIQYAYVTTSLIHRE